ncbi:MAG TPA: cbb3-type cytochrome c oxidase subunit II, partial [Novosphingobium sp.]|nr:cbb3-type cytochrome c oxidase subunit II [Novosphingobium sp.]
LQTKYLGDDLRALRAVGVPYTDDMIANAPADAVAQASPDDDTAGLVKRYGVATQIRGFDGDKGTTSEMDALVAYLQVLGKLSNAAQPTPAPKE